MTTDMQQLQLTVQEQYFSQDAKFSTNEGFQIAAAVTSYDGDSSPIEDLTFGTVKFYKKKFGIQDDGSEGLLTFDEIESELCN